MTFKKLRRVTDHVDTFLPEDHNDHVDNWLAQLAFNKSMRQYVPDPSLDDLIARLESTVSSMRKVSTGDFYYADDHNKFVDAWALQTQINNLLRTGVAAANASGIDPNAPAWAPPEGWDKVWEFRSVDELNDFATYQENAYVGGDRIYSDTIDRGELDVERYIEGQTISRAAFCFKYFILASLWETAAAALDIGDEAGNYIYTSLWTVTGSEYAMKISDDVSGAESSFEYYGDWLVYMVDFPDKIFRIYNRRGEVLAELPLSTGVGWGPGYDIWVSSCFYGGMRTIDTSHYYRLDVVFDVQVDWVAVKY